MPTVDAYHTPVSPVDVWAEYARLRDEEKWTQEKIAQVKRVDEAWVSKRQKWHDCLSAKTKQHVATGELTEGHLDAITGVVASSQLSDRLTTEQAWEELAAKVVHDAGKNGSKSVRALRDDVKVWKEFIGAAQIVYDDLPEEVQYVSAKGTEGTYDPRDFFVHELNQTTRDSYTASLAVDSLSVPPEPSAAQAQATALTPLLLVGCAAGTADAESELRVSSHRVLHCTNVLWFELVVREARAGDPQAAQQRLDELTTLPLLEVSEEAVALAQELLKAGAVPEQAAEDALHIAMAVTNGVEYLLTWNCKHLANATMRTRIEEACRTAGYAPVVNCTPEELLEG